ncbi:hypothetical protein RD792_005415 [Penstemon davidsonii]|uniref:Serine-threonine/tyrosine-protein kinase catalytic domain-containing protein n=1 Tax=Penstemon davidsonii TaxID=160366 RepID=A0ABR0DK33_9LAMI|nr:hypothetical protein RD792_005415 [Penstemon davidsonii]
MIETEWFVLQEGSCNEGRGLRSLGYLSSAYNIAELGFSTNEYFDVYIRVPDYLAVGYRALEVTHTKTVSQASDVFSFGVVLIELVSDKTSQIITDDGKVKMNRYYDNWEKLVEAVIKREQIRALSLDSSRSPSTRSVDSDFSLSSSSHYDSEYLSSRPTPTPSPLHPETVKHKLVEIVGKGKQTGKSGFSSKKENGKEESEPNWTNDRRTLYGSELFREAYSVKEIAEEAKRRAEIARLRTWNQLTITTLEPKKEIHQLSRDKDCFKEVSQIAEEVKRRADIARKQLLEQGSRGRETEPRGREKQAVGFLLCRTSFRAAYLLIPNSECGSVKSVG